MVRASLQSDALRCGVAELNSRKAQPTGCKQSIATKNCKPSIVEGFDDSREIRNVVFENLKINERVISDNMPGKPGYFKTGGMARIFVGEHVEGIVFRASDGTAAGSAKGH